MKLFMFLLLLCISLPARAQAKRQANDLDTLLDRYTQSIDDADSLKAKKTWSQDAEVSFINPMGSAYGWNGIKNIYAFFLHTFSKRNIRYHDERWTNYGDFAWVTFDWTFDATLSADHKDIETKGRETQFWKKTGGNWRLVHVHYSAMP